MFLVGGKMHVLNMHVPEIAMPGFLLGFMILIQVLMIVGQLFYRVRQSTSP